MSGSSRRVPNTRSDIETIDALSLHAGCAKLT
jgi:hypothetical protein